MVILNRVKAATLIEVLVASAIILIVFLIGSLSLNNVFISGIKNNDALLQCRVSELSYLLSHGKIQVPYYDVTENYDITIEKFEGNLVIKTLHKPSNKEQSIIIEK